MNGTELSEKRDPMTSDLRHPRYRRVLSAGGRGLITIPLLAEALARPAYQPLLRAVSRLTILQRLDRWVAAKPRWLILAVLAVPFLGVEPLKVLGLVWIGEGLILRGLGLLGFAYGTSFVLVERIYRAGRDKLRSYHWLAACIDFAVSIRDAALASLRTTRAWQIAEETGRAAAKSVSASLRWIRAKLQRTGRLRRV
jgi:hypothetical protein